MEWSLANATKPRTQFNNPTTEINGIITNCLPETSGSLLDLTLMRRNQVEIGINALILFVLFIVALFGNFLVIVAIVNSNNLRNQLSNILIVNLSITDITSALVVMSTSFLAVALDIEYIHPVWCNACCIMNYVCIIVSMLTLAFISVDRYFAIIHALTYSVIMTKSRMLIMVGYSWFQGAAFAAAPALLKWVHYDYWEAICAIDWHREKVQAVYYVIVAFILCFVVPGGVMTAAYFSIIREARKVLPLNGAINAPQQDQLAKKAAKTVKSLLIVVVFFFICMTPFCITKLLKVIFDNKNLVPTYTNLTAAYFQFAASGVNPFIYAIFRLDFRNAFQRILKKAAAQHDFDTGISMQSM